jgi:hypothetical protein
MARRQRDTQTQRTTQKPRTGGQVGGGGGTPPPDPAPTLTVPPALVAGGATTTSLTLTWTWNQFVQSWAEYGTTISYGSETRHEESFDYARHQQTIDTLAPGTLYHVRVHGINQYGQSTTSGDYTFTTSGVTPAPEPPPPTGGGLSGYTYTDYTVPSGITTISALQTFVNSVPNGASSTAHSRVLLGAGRTYTGPSGLVVNNKQHMTFEGGGTQVTYGHTGGAVIASTGPWGNTSSSCFYSSSTGTQDLVFHCLTALGSSPSSGGGAYASSTAGKATDGTTAQEYAMGFCFYGIQGVIIDHCIMDRNKGDGVYLAMSGGQWSRNAVIRDCTIQRNGRMGFGLIAIDGIVGQRIYFQDICYSPIDYEPNVTGEGARGVNLWEDIRIGRYSWDNTHGEGACVFITSPPGAVPTYNGSLTLRRLVVVGKNQHPSYVSKSGSMFYLHRSTAKDWSLLMEYCDGAAAEGPGNYVVAMAGWRGATTIRHNNNMIAGTPALGVWVYDGGGNTGARNWQTADEA